MRVIWTLLAIFAVSASAWAGDARDEAQVILTPKPSPRPRINGTMIFGVRPGHPLLYTIAATGKRPMRFAAEGLPEGLTLDSQTGRLGGATTARGEHVVTLRATNELGSAERKLRIVVGDRLALTPYMGWNHWYIWTVNASDKIIRDAADAMVANGMINHGYAYVNMDECCWLLRPKNHVGGGPPRIVQSQIDANRRFPDMKALADYIHRRGFKAGIYSSPGPSVTNDEVYVGSYRHEAEDARRFAAWGYDFLKYDWCSYEEVAGGKDLAHLKKPYELMWSELQKVDRDIVLNLCQYGMGDVWTWGASCGNSWRTAGDLGEPFYDIPNRVLHDGFELYAKRQLHKFAGPGGWNDPDYLLLGYLRGPHGPERTPLSPNEQYAQVSLWSLVAAPLIFSGDVTRLDDFTLGLLVNDEVIDVDQDPLGRAAHRAAKQGESEVWVRELEDGSKAVGLFNHAKAEAAVAGNWTDLGVRGKQTVRDLWRQKDLGQFEGRFSAAVPPHGVVLVRLTPAAPAAEPKHRELSAVPFSDVKLDDAFWSPRLQTNRERSLPHNFKWCEQTGRISNFVKAAGAMPGKFEGAFFNDSDVYKVLEGASYSLADRPDPALEKLVDGVIAKIAAAQQKDGYLNCYYTLVEPGKRWTNLPWTHELYCAGHLMEAAVAHWRATGKRTLLDVAVKFADHIDGVFGPGKKLGVPGHEEVELGLVKLYHATGDERYFKLAKFFIDLRGDASRHKLSGQWNQDHEPVRKQSKIVGHAVRAMYLYSGVADVAAETGDQELIQAMGRLWRDVVESKMYVTGGIGVQNMGEGFGGAYALYNDRAYCETCAAIGLALWAHRLNLLHGDAQYADVLERAIYNGILSGIALDGEHFFYVNPLSSAGNHHRQPFFSCACCPTNVVRFIPSIPGYVYAIGADGIFVNLYAAGAGKASLGGATVALTQETRYPWDGRVKLRVEPREPGEFAIHLRIPGWCKGATLAVNGQPLDKLVVEKGYALLRRTWKPGDVVDLNLPMEVERIEAHPRVEADRGRVALQRGPIVYCFEAVDNGGEVKDIMLPRDPKFTAEHRKDLLGGVTVIHGTAEDGRQITAVPYYAWDHREPGPMIVWVYQYGKSPTPGSDDPTWEGKLYRPLDPAALGTCTPLSFNDLIHASASHCWREDSVETLNDGREPHDSGEGPRFTWYDHRGTKEWVEYEFPAVRKVSAVEVFWFDDARGKGNCRVPQSWQLFYKDGDAWKPVAGASSYGAELNKYNRVSFTPVEASGLRIEVQLKPGFSGGILQWKWE